MLSTSIHAEKPSLSKILTLQTPDLESQDHILTYQLPVALSRHNIGLVIIDSIAANYRAERDGPNIPSALATRSAQLVRLGAQLRELARLHNCAIVVANQVADRFPPIIPRPYQNTYNLPSSPQPSPQQIHPQHPPVSNPLTLDHQQRFFTGWGSSPTDGNHNLKTPSLGLVWANQIACRVALIKESSYAEEEGSAEWAPRGWRRWIRVVFAAWAPPTMDGERGVEIEVWAGGVRAVGEGEKVGLKKGQQDP